jgi:PAS domain-containing protein
MEANDAFLKIVQYDREDLATGRVRWTDLSRTAHALAELRNTGSIQRSEKEYHRKDGSRVPVLVGVAALMKNDINSSPSCWI